jgi:hypothetical protein
MSTITTTAPQGAGRPRPAGPGRPSRSPLYRTVLSLAVAAIIAASIPFAALYGRAVQNQSAAVATLPVSAGPSTGTTTRIVTTASGARIAQTVPVTGSGASGASVSAAPSAAAAVPISTRTS